MNGSTAKMDCFLNKDEHCVVLAIPEEGTKITLASVFRSIVMKKVMSWRELATFAGIKRSSIAWQIAYKNRPSATMELLNDYLIIDESKKQVRFYDFEHKPEGVVFPHVGPKIVNGEPSSTTVFTKVPVRLTSRIRINDPLQRLLTMTLKPTAGYLIGFNDVNLARPNMTYQVVGSINTLNRILKNIHFVGMIPGDGTIIISIDDCEGDSVTSVSSTTVSFKIEQSKEVSIPELNLPEDQTGTIGEDTEIDPVTVSDADNKLIELHITPFGCLVHGFKNNPFIVGGSNADSKKMEVIYGRPATINDFIAHLVVRPTQEVSYLGVSLYCDKTKIDKYLKIVSTAPNNTTSDTTEPTSNSSNTDNTANTSNTNNTSDTPDSTVTPDTLPSTSDVTLTPVQPTDNTEPDKPDNEPNGVQVI